MHTTVKQKIYFVTGIGTDIGKTIASAIIVEALQADYWKPVQAGSENNSDSEIIRNLISNNKTKIHPETYFLKAALSPHAAAELENKKIDSAKINIPKTNNHLIIEGAGGLMVPLNDSFFVIDLIEQMNCEVILVTKNYLGSINHTLLSIELLKKRNISVAGIVINGEENKASEKIILQQSNYKLIGRIKEEAAFDKTIIKNYAVDFSLQL